MNDLIEDIRKKSKEVPEVPAPEVALKLQMVSVELLSVDPEYQRKVTDTGRKKIAKMVSGFDWSRFGALSVSQDPDNSDLNVTDGQHRLLAARVLGVSRVPCVIGQGDQCKQAADFVAINTVRSGVPSIDKFRARVVALDETAMKVDEVLRELEITTDVVPGYPLKPKQTRAVLALERLIKRLSEGVVFVTLETLIEQQPTTPNLLTAFTIEAVAMVVARMIDAERDLARLDAVITDLDFDTLKEEAAQIVKVRGGKLAKHGADQLLQRINKGLRDKVA